MTVGSTVWLIWSKACFTALRYTFYPLFSRSVLCSPFCLLESHLGERKRKGKGNGKGREKKKQERGKQKKEKGRGKEKEEGKRTKAKGKGKRGGKRKGKGHPRSQTFEARKFCFGGTWRVFRSLTCLFPWFLWFRAPRPSSRRALGLKDKRVAS